MSVLTINLVFSIVVGFVSLRKVFSDSFQPSVNVFNQWQPFSNWNKNGPSQMGALYATTPIIVAGLEGQQLLMVSPGHQFDDKNTSTTWIFQPALNSWISLFMPTVSIPNIQHYSLTTLCSTTAVLFGGHEMHSGRPLNQTWVFSGTSKTWYLSSTSKAPESRYGHGAAVTTTQSRCGCEQSVIMFGGKGIDGRVFDDLWRLECVLRDGNELYLWNELKSFGETPQARYFHALISSVHINGIIVAAGYGNDSEISHELWTYWVTDQRWSKLSTKLPCLHNTSSIVRTTGSYAKFRDSKGEHNVAIMCCSSCPVIYNPNDGTVLTKSDLRILGYPDLGPHPPGSDKGTTNISLSSFDEYAVILTNDNQRSIWNLSFTFQSKYQMSWTKLVQPQTAPTAVFTQQVALTVTTVSEDLRPTMIAIGNVSPVSTDQTIHEIWMLNLKSGQWYQSIAVNRPAIGYSAVTLKLRSKPFLVLYGGVQNYRASTSQTSIFFPWKNEENHLEGPSCRFFHSSTAVSAETAIIFGGLVGCSSYHCSNDMWNFTLVDSSNSMGVSGRWINISQVNPPPARCGHSAAKVGSAMIVYGGLNQSSGPCHNDMWLLYDSDGGGWKEVTRQPNSIYPGNRCFHSVATFGQKMFLTGGCESLNDFGLYYAENCKMALSGLWLFSLEETQIDASKWFLLIESGSPVQPGPFAALALWNFPSSTPEQNLPYLVAAGGLWTDKGNSLFSLARVGCPQGYFAANFATDVCRPCHNGTYASGGSVSCTECPSYLSSLGTATSVLNCTLCSDDKYYCGEGTCRVDAQSVALGKYSQSINCDCVSGYKLDHKSNCTINSERKKIRNWVLGSVLVASFVTVAAVLLAIFIQNSIQNSKMLRIERQEDERSRQMEYDHLESKEVIGEGNYGVVSKALWGGKRVALKELKDSIELVELKTMTKALHPNVVRVIGGGFRYPQEKRCPFIVMEYCAGGNLYQRIESKTMDDRQKLKFAAGIADAMNYMHNLTALTPTFHQKRKELYLGMIHLDLKPSNFLIHKEIVKLGDFGLATRFVYKERNVDYLKSADHHGVNSETAWLLDRKNLGGSGNYCAPELRESNEQRRNVQYTKLDVYSFGVVLWTMWKNDLEPSSTPQIPTTAPPSSVYKDITTLCLSENPDERPPFSKVSHQLRENIESF